MHQALYRKWRPQLFSDVVGQNAVADTLRAQIASGRTSHAYIFSGSRGTGKTTCARILAKAVNCENPINGEPCNTCASCRAISDGEAIDISEIDAASYGGVEDARRLCEEAVYTPASLKKRVYIIDEVHMYSAFAFNALLKLIEEPPAHIMLILATTELHKVIETVRSRCQCFTFKRISSNLIAERLMYVSRAEGRELCENAAAYIASMADGGMRDALSLLDQCMSLTESAITIDLVDNVCGRVGTAATVRILSAITCGNADGALQELNRAYEDGKRLNSLFAELYALMRDVLISSIAPKAELPRISGGAFADKLREFADCDAERLTRAMQIITESTAKFGASQNSRIDAELALVRMCLCYNSEPAIASSTSATVSKKTASVTPASSTPASSTSATVSKKAASVTSAAVTLASSTPAPVTSASATSATPEIKNMSALWRNIVKTASRSLSTPGVAPIIGGYKIALEENVLYIYKNEENRIGNEYLKESANMEALVAAAEKVIGRRVAIKLTDEPAGEEIRTGDDPLDELCTALEDDPTATII